MDNKTTDEERASGTDGSTLPGRSGPSSGAGASAQTTMGNVTIFGLLDVNVTHYKRRVELRTPPAPARCQAARAMEDGTVNGLNGSRCRGVRAAEPISGDVTVGAWLESGFGVDTGGSFQRWPAVRPARRSPTSVRRPGADLPARPPVRLRGRDPAAGQPVRQRAAVQPDDRRSPTTAASVATMLDAPRADNVVQLQRRRTSTGF